MIEFRVCRFALAGVSKFSFTHITANAHKPNCYSLRCSVRKNYDFIATRTNPYVERLFFWFADKLHNVMRCHPLLVLS